MWDDGRMESGANTIPNLPLRQTQRVQRDTSPVSAWTRKWISAAVVTLLALFAGVNAAWLNSLWVSVIVVFVAGTVLVIGWERLIGTPIPLPSQIFISLSTLVAGIAVAFVKDQAAIVFVVGVVMAGLVGIEIWTAPVPRDHSTALESDSRELNEEQLTILRRNSWVVSSASSSLAASMTGLMIAVGGAAWIAMSATDAWRLLLPIAAAIVAGVVIGDQFGSTWVGQSLWALLAGVTTGAVGAVSTLSLGVGSTLGHLVLPSVAQFFGPRGTVVVLAVGTGVIISVAVMVIDAVFGDHHFDNDRLAAASRGAVKFLLCGLVVYTVLRVAGS